MANYPFIPQLCCDNRQRRQGSSHREMIPKIELQNNGTIIRHCTFSTNIKYMHIHHGHIQNAKHDFSFRIRTSAPDLRFCSCTHPLTHHLSPTNQQQPQSPGLLHSTLNAVDTSQRELQLNVLLLFSYIPEQ